MLAIQLPLNANLFVVYSFPRQVASILTSTDMPCKVAPIAGMVPDLLEIGRPLRGFKTPPMQTGAWLHEAGYQFWDWDSPANAIFHCNYALRIRSTKKSKKLVTTYVASYGAS